MVAVDIQKIEGSVGKLTGGLFREQANESGAIAKFFEPGNWTPPITVLSEAIEASGKTGECWGV
jgi:hypothetical protein